MRESQRAQVTVSQHREEHALYYSRPRSWTAVKSKPFSIHGRGLFSGEQGWRSGESARLPLMCPRFDSPDPASCGLSLLVLYSAPRGFSPGTPVFPSPQKPTFDLI